ncbi:MAG: DUF4258 domain-containing protein [Isosphaerales bacterium]
MAKRVIFAEVTPLGDRVLLTRDRWREILRYKHPALANHEDEVRECVRDPDFVRASAKDQDTHLYYRTVDLGYLCVVLGGDNPQQRFVITAYFTQSPKKGLNLWTK